MKKEIRRGEGCFLTAYDFFGGVYHLKSEKILQEIQESAKVRNLKKGEFLIRIGEIQKDVYFLDSGIFRGYFLNKDGKEITDCICFRRGTAAMATCRMEPGTPSPMAIEMLEEGRFFLCPHAGHSQNADA